MLDDLPVRGDEQPLQPDLKAGLFAGQGQRLSRHLRHTRGRRASRLPLGCW